eukprot:Nitzschia sp. Nitz4//scaffold23_size168460//57788//62374//NITZ4_002213-RA/size168460-processed-gene-0.76-mRNA-1//1//CDS//3329543617//3696//frame0
MRVWMQLCFLTGASAITLPAEKNSKLLLDYRRKLEEGQSSYRPRHLHPLVCTYLSDEQCEYEDTGFAIAAGDNMSMLRTASTSKLLSDSTTVKVSNTNDVELSSFPTTTMRILVVLLQWSDHGDRTLIPKEDIEAMFNGEGIDDTLYPSGSIANYTSLNSYGKIQFEAVVADWYQSEYTEAYIADGRSAIPSGDPDFADALIPALDYLDEQGMDWGQFDGDGNYRIDSMIVLHTGYAAEKGVDCNSVASTDRIQSIARYTTGFRASTGYGSGNYAITSVYRGVCNYNMARIGTMTHEFIHTVGLPDLYDLDGQLYSTGNVGGIGGFDIMANPSGQGNREASPGHLSAWSKIQLGFADPVDITTDGTYTLRASEAYNDFFTISTPYTPGEYLLIENRQPVYFDNLFWDDGGIVIYHIDDNVVDVDTGSAIWGNRQRGGTFQDDWPGNFLHYPVAVLQADGEYNLEQALDNGGSSDLWGPGDVLGPGNGELVHSTANYPNTDGYSDSEIRVTGITIDEFTETEPGVWSFRVTGLGETTLAPQSGTNVPTEVSSPSPSSAPTMSSHPTLSIAPSISPTLSVAPSGTPSLAPSASPSVSMAPSVSASPSASPTTSMAPSISLQPTDAPTTTHIPTFSPTASPSKTPTAAPSSVPTAPTSLPSISPTTRPTQVQTSSGSHTPTDSSPVPTSSGSTHVHERCEYEDSHFKEAAENNMKHLRSLSSGKGSGDSPNDVSVKSFSTSNFKVLVVLLQWSDHGSRTLISRDDIDAMFNGQGVDNTLYPAGSVANYTSLNSYGKINLEATVADWFQSDYTESYIADGRAGVPSGDPDFEDALVPILDYLDDQGMDWSQFDGDGDMRIDSIIVLHTGYAAEQGVDCNSVPSTDRIQSIARFTSAFRSRTGYASGNYAVASVYRGVCNYNMARMGTMTHEFIHTVGLPDLYDLDGQLYSTGNVGGIGGFDIMANPWGQGNRQARPGHLCPWSKIQLGFADPVEITSDGTYTLRASEEYNDFFTISTPYTPGEYLIIENRQPIYFDDLFWDDGGIVIYHIDDNVVDVDTGDAIWGNRQRGGPFQNDWPGNFLHYPVAVLQADGEYNLEQALDNGGASDLWASGDVLGPGNGELVHSTANYPNTDGYSDSEIRVTGITIDQFTETSSGVWSFRVTGLGAATPAPTQSPTQSPTRAPVEGTHSPTTPPTFSPTRAPIEGTHAPTSAPSASGGVTTRLAGSLFAVTTFGTLLAAW